MMFPRHIAINQLISNANQIYWLVSIWWGTLHVNGLIFFNQLFSVEFWFDWFSPKLERFILILISISFRSLQIFWNPVIIMSLNKIWIFIFVFVWICLYIYLFVLLSGCQNTYLLGDSSFYIYVKILNDNHRSIYIYILTGKSGKTSKKM